MKEGEEGNKKRGQFHLVILSMNLQKNNNFSKSQPLSIQLYNSLCWKICVKHICIPSMLVVLTKSSGEIKLQAKLATS